MAKETTVDTSALGRDIMEMQSIIDNARAQLKKAEDEIETSYIKWEGSAKAVFMIRFMNDYQNTEKLFDVAEQFINAMQYAKEQYESCANEVRDLIHTIHIE